MNLPSVCRSVLGLALLLIAYCLPAQNLSPIAAEVLHQADAGVSFSVIKPFTIIHARDREAIKIAPNAQFLTLDESVLQNAVQYRLPAIALHIPYQNEVLTLDLVRSEITTDDFSVLNERESAELYTPGVHYRGILRHDPHSVVSISFFENEMMGIVSGDRFGNLVIGRLDHPDNHNQYIVYSDREMTVKNPFSCAVLEADDHSIQVDPHGAGMPESVVNGCVRVFLEVDNELFVEKGSVQNTVNYLLAAWNQVATLYTNEQINISISQILVWTTPDAYSTTSSATVLDQFRTFRTSFNGDLAHLVGSGGNNLGGIAYLDVLCQSAYNRAYSDITGSYSNVPTYSWTIEVMTHEMGHNLGSNHTQWCGWSGGAIDGCVGPEGACNAGPAPTNGGTIMSYCHLTGYGINFNNGFGTQPGNRIRTEVGSATCLSPSCAPPSACGVPADLNISSITGSGATIGWTNVSGANSYTLRYRVVGASQWTTLTNATNPTTLSGLPNNDEVEVTVQSVCGGSTSDALTGLIFKTGATGGGGNSGCNAPTNLTATPAATSANAAWTAAAGASSYNISWKIATSSTWGAAVNTTANSFTINNLNPSTTYNVRVQSNCSGSSSSYLTSTFTTGAAATCNAPTNLSASPTSNSANVSWGGVSGAGSYALSWKTTTSSTWSTPVTLTSTAYTISNLSASTTYNYRVQTNCTGGTSGFATGNFTTTAGGASCGAPASISAAPTASTAAITWAGVSGASSYAISWKASSSANWSVAINVSGTSYTISNLQANTSYNVRVRTACTNGAVSGYTNGSFTTTASGNGSCGTPSNLTGTTTASIITASWTGVAGALSYTIQWKTITSSTWSSPINVASTNYSITGLSAGTSYNVRVRANCAGGASSAFVTTTLTTQSGGGGGTCLVPAGLAAGNIGTSSARISWNATQYAMNYNLQIKPASSSTWVTFGNLPTTIVTVQSLSPSTTYQVRVRSNCAGGAASAYSAIVSFTTATLMPADDIGEMPAEGSSLAITGHIALAPNPATDRVNVQIDLPSAMPIRINLLDTYGRLVQTQMADFQSGSIELDLSQVAPGIYFVQPLAEGVRLPVRRLVRGE
jgi:Metallo-peptidase family M12/Secretion system C-terminal sorting domain/Fibronectin type III domain